MNKLIYLMLVFLLCLCSCSNEIAENSSFSLMSTDESNESIADNTEKLGSVDGFAIYAKSGVLGTRNELDASSIPPTVNEIPNVEYEIVDSDGNLLVPHPFYYCFFLTPGMWGAHEEYPCISGSWKGNYYRYVFVSGKFEQDTFIPAGETNEEAFGYKLTRYCWYNVDINYGLNDSAGNAVLEPIYVRIFVPFEDRFVLYEGGFGMLTSAGEGQNRIVDSSKNTIAVYTTANFNVFSDGSYFGIGSVAPEPVAECYDSFGIINESGYWFIDKDGNRISKRFEYIPVASSSDEILSATDENGNAVEIKISDYICRP